MEAGVQFWSQALGMTVQQPDDPASPYVALTGEVAGFRVGLQRVDDPSRVHLDIETDNVEAEVQRLEKLGARRQAYIKTWWVMEAPSGHLFCVISAPNAETLAQAHVWED
jgi:predicted enzyme related to lactoylglutathione lyase